MNMTPESSPVDEPLPLPSPIEVVGRLLEGVAQVINGDPDAVQEIVSLYAENTDVRHLMSPHAQVPLTTHDELRAHFAAGPEDHPVPGFRAVDIQMHQTGDPEVVVAEFSWATSNDSFPCVFVTRVRDGLIIESRDYIDHPGSARLFARS